MLSLFDGDRLFLLVFICWKNLLERRPSIDVLCALLLLEPRAAIDLLWILELFFECGAPVDVVDILFFLESGAPIQLVELPLLPKSWASVVLHTTATAPVPPCLTPFSSTWLAALWWRIETSALEELLLFSREDELGAALNAGQCLIFSTDAPIFRRWERVGF
jgi:hypothetical protein